MLYVPSNSDPLLTVSEIARLVSVQPAAVTNWVRRHPGFPAPIATAGGNRFLQSAVLSWLGGREIPSQKLEPHEPAGTTYEARARRRLAAAASSPARPATAHPVPRPRRPGIGREQERSIEQLMGTIADRVRGSGSMRDYLNLLASLLFLRICAPDVWRQLKRGVPPARDSKEAARLLWRIGHATDRVLGQSGMPTGMTESVSRLHPRSYQDLVEALQRSEGLGQYSLEPMLQQYGEHAAKGSGDHFTPPALTELIAQLVAVTAPRGAVTVLDPYARGGELLTAATAALRQEGRTQIEARGACTDASTHRLAAMNLALHGLPVQLTVGPPLPGVLSPPGAGAHVVVTNPPFNSKHSGADQGVLNSGLEDDWPFGAPPTGNDNYGWLQHAVRHLRPDGRAAVLMPNQAAASADEREQSIREHMLAAGVVESVISLPPRLFAATTIPVSLWLLRAPDPDASERDVLFIDARSSGVRSTARTSTIPAEARERIVSVYAAWHRSREGTGGAFTPAEGVSAVATASDIAEKDNSFSPIDYVAQRPPRTGQAAYESLDEARKEADRYSRCARLADRTAAAAAEALHMGRQADHWEKVWLCDLFDIQAGPSGARLSSIPVSREEEVPLVQPGHLRDRRLTEPGERVSAADARALHRFALDPGDVVCVRSGSTGGAALVEPDQRGWIMHTNLLRLRLRKPDTFDSEFLIAYLSLRGSRAWIRNRSREATAIPSISSRALGKYRIPCPPLAEQRRLGQALGALDRQIVAHRAHLEALGAARMAWAEHLLADALPSITTDSLEELS